MFFGFVLTWFFSFLFSPTFLYNFSFCSLSITAILSFLSACLRQHWVTCCSFTFICSEFFFPFSSSYKVFSYFATVLLWKLPSFPSLSFFSPLLLAFPRDSLSLLSAEDTTMQIINESYWNSPLRLSKPGLQPARLLHFPSISQASFLPVLSRSCSLLPHSFLQADTQTTSLMIPTRSHHWPQQKLHSTANWKEGDEQCRSAQCWSNFKTSLAWTADVAKIVSFQSGLKNWNFPQNSTKNQWIKTFHSSFHLFFCLFCTSFRTNW